MGIYNSKPGKTLVCWPLLILGFLPRVMVGNEPQAIYLTWQGDTNQTITINYLTSEKDAKSIVYYDTESRGGDLEKYRFTAGGRSHSLPGIPSGPKVHRTKLKDLEPGGTYYFVAGDPQYGVLAERKFRTIPNDGSALRFVSGGDMGIGETVRQLLRQAAAREPHFALIGGDIAYANGNPANLYIWEEWMTQWTEEMITPQGFTVPVVLAIGNHEVSSRYDGKVEDAPFYFGFFAQSGRQSYFRRQFGPNLVVYFLDSGHIASHQSQVSWLEDQMEADQAIPNRFAIYHVPLYPSHRPYSGFQSEQGRLHWEPVFSHYGLTAAFENHDHTFKRSKKILNGQVAPEGQGVIYLGDGAWGRSPRTIPVQQPWYLDKSSSSQHFWLVDVSEEGNLYRAVDKDGRVFDVYPTESAESASAEAYFQTIEQSYMYSPDSLAISPLLTEKKRFQKGSFTVTLTNKEPYPLEGTVSMSTPDDEELRVKPVNRSVKLAPGESDNLKFSLKSNVAKSFETIAPVRMEVNLDYLGETRTIRKKISRPIKVDHLFSATRRKQAPEIDGLLEDWPDLPNVFQQPVAFNPQNMADFWEGPEDTSLRFAMAYDQNAVYLAVSAIDDEVQTLTGHRPRRQDSLFFWIDIFPGGVEDDDPLFALIPGNSPEESSLVPLEEYQGTIKAVSLISETGYNAEIAFPMDAFRPALEKRATGKLEYIRFNIAFMDKDMTGQKPLKIYWRPRWQSHGDYNWSGVFKLE